MNRLITQHEGIKLNIFPDARVWIAKVIVREDWIEGRGRWREEAISDLIDRLVDRLEDRDRLRAGLIEARRVCREYGPLSDVRGQVIRITDAALEGSDG